MSEIEVTATCPVCEMTLRDHHTCEGPLTDGELAFRDLQRNPRAWREWCAKRRARWAKTAAGLLAARRLKG